jgi:hypothetical protein
VNFYVVWCLIRVDVCGPACPFSDWYGAFVECKRETASIETRQLSGFYHRGRTTLIEAMR